MLSIPQPLYYLFLIGVIAGVSSPKKDVSLFHLLFEHYH